MLLENNEVKNVVDFVHVIVYHKHIIKLEDT